VRTHPLWSVSGLRRSRGGEGDNPVQDSPDHSNLMQTCFYVCCGVACRDPQGVFGPVCRSIKITCQVQVRIMYRWNRIEGKSTYKVGTLYTIPREICSHIML